METGLCDPMASWSFQLEVHRHPTLHVFLVVVEEPVELSSNLCCKHCQYTGWGNNLVCNKKYHFLLPSKETISACLSFEGNSSNSMDSLASKCNFIELQGHTMHGVFHSNGFGHLLCINGAETGSDLAGYQIMEFWDRLCTGLRARFVSAPCHPLLTKANTHIYKSMTRAKEVSLRDISQKRGMDLRLLHAVAYGKTWFGQWGYIYGRGSFGVKQLMYQNAIEALQNIPLDLLAHHLVNDKTETIATVSRYQMLSGHSLVTLVDLFHFMLELKSRLPKERSAESSHPGVLVDASCRWSPKRVEMAIKVVIEALKQAEYRWVSRQEVRDTARAYIGDTGLLDFVLKSLGNHTVGKYFVRRCMNPVTKVLEYCLEDMSHAFPKQDGYGMNFSNLKPQYNITWAQLMKDLFRLYKHILKENKAISGGGIISHMPVASRIILDTKYFIKKYSREPAILDNHEVYCSVVFVSKSEAGLRKVITPHECFMLRTNTTFNELKLAVEKTFRDLYRGLRNLTVESVANFEAVKGSDLVFKLIKVGSLIVFEGKVAEEENLDIGWIQESADCNSVVDCRCGTTVDDGERMVSCDICEVWQHTRCVKIPNHEEVPSIFLCCSCEQYLLRFPSLP